MTDWETRRPEDLLAGRYRLGPRIGAGATADVYEAHDTLLGREAAVKVFHDAQWEEEQGRFSEEVRLLATLAHPHLVPLYDAGVAGPHRFIVMPVIRGTTLAEEIKRGPLDPDEVRRIGVALADALAYIHARGVVHRDIKPGNVLLDEDGTPFLADFGFAHAEDSPALTATNCLVGTAGYLAPERAEGRGAGPASDVYALGLVLLEALTGRREYSGTPVERAVGNALRPPTIPTWLELRWRAAIQAMTARNPENRPGIDELRMLLRSDGSASAPTMADTMQLRPVSPALTALRGRHHATVFSAIAAALLVAFMATALRPSGASSTARSGPSTNDKPAVTSTAGPATASSTVSIQPAAEPSGRAASTPPPAAGSASASEQTSALSPTCEAGGHGKGRGTKGCHDH